MNYLVTGIAGFIGSSIAKRLLDLGHTVVGVDNMNDYYSPVIKHSRLDGLPIPERFILYFWNVCDPLDMVFQERYFDGIFHMAAIPGIRYSIDNPLYYAQNNVMGAANVLEYARNFGVKRMVMASTSSLYAGHDLPFTEDLPCNSPLCPYSASKKGMEALAYTYHHLHGLNIACTRFFTVYGPNGRPDMAPRLFFEKIINGEEITIYGDGHQKRDYTYIDDIVDGCIRAMGIDGYEIINLGYGQPHSLIDMVRLIEQATGEQARVNFLPPQPGDMLDTHASIEKARTLLGWEPQVSLEEGIGRMVNWHLGKRLKEVA